MGKHRELLLPHFIVSTMPQPFGNELFGCFADPRLCIITFIVPCYTIGKNAEHFGEDCLLVGLLSCIGLAGFGSVLRWRLRQEKDLEGSMFTDVLIYMFLSCCALVQEAREIQGESGAVDFQMPPETNKAMARN